MLKRELEFYNQLLRLSKEIGDKAGEGASYNGLGSVYQMLGDFKQAEMYHKKHLDIAKELKDTTGEGSAYGNLGIVSYSVGDYTKAKDYYMQRLSIAKDMGDKAGEAAVYCNLGAVCDSLGEFKQAMEYHKQHLRIAKEVGDRAGEGRAYGNLGNACYGLSDFKTALEYHKQHLSIVKELGYKFEEGGAYGNLGNVWKSLGDFEQAISYYKQYLSIAVDLGDKAGEGRAFGNLGIAYRKLGDFKAAIDHGQQHLRITKELSDRHGEGYSYGNLGIVYRCLGDFEQAIKHCKKLLDIAEELGDRTGERNAYGNLANAYNEKNDFETAIKYYNKLLISAKELGDRAGEGAVYGNLGNAYRRLGKVKEAIEYFGQCLSIAKELGDRAAEGKAYGLIGNYYQTLGDFQQAVEYHKQSMYILHELGQKVDEADVRCSLGCDFDHAGALLEALDYYRSSVQLYNDARVLLRSEDVLKISFRNKCGYAYTALWTTLIRLGKTDEALCVAEAGRAQALKDLLRLQYSSDLLASDPVQAKENISDILSQISTQTVFVALDRDTIHFWIASEGKDIKFRQKKVEREDAVIFLESLRKNAFKEIRGAGQVRCENRSLDEQRDGTSEETVQETGTTSSHSESNSLNLFHNCIVSPIADLLEGDELIIVPDGPLCLAPIAAFLDDEPKYLSENIRVRILPSLMSLKQITDCPEDYHTKSGVLLVGDPYVKDVKRVKGKRVQLDQLPCALEEVKMIGKILNTEPLTGRDATKEEVLQRISSVALVHIAAHGDMENGEIALAPNPTGPSKVPKDDEFLLKMSDIQAVQLRAKLVVLSCCHSAQGKVSAEGVVGIARAFLGAGARSVVVSLWAIDDEATMEFMKRFYQCLSRGDSASVALNKAMKCLRESEKFGAVKYWAPFLLIGDDATIEFAEKAEHQEI